MKKYPDENYSKMCEFLESMFNTYEKEKRLKITSDFKKSIFDVIIWACSSINAFDDLYDFLIEQPNIYRARCVIISFCICLSLLDDDLDAYNKLKGVINNSEFISNIVKPSAIVLLDKEFKKIYNNEKLECLIDERNRRKEIVLNEEDFVRIMEEHHRYKWGNHMPFIIERETEKVNGDQLYNLKPRYVYRDSNSEFYLNEDIIKNILSEYFDEYEVEYIEIHTSHYKNSWVDYTINIERDEKGYPVDQESIRMMRHPGMYQHGYVTPVFNGIKVYVKERKNKDCLQLVR